MRLVAALPLGDWQFWAVTSLFALAVLWLLRGSLPVVGKRFRRGRKQRRVNITVGGKTVR